ncbi:MAG: hypothetical protein HQL13_00380 [Candidatus Omnitrophica bacterium]|nr:hypothetical protein [Candidatus Omnitrophota bacterium]
MVYFSKILLMVWGMRLLFVLIAAASKLNQFFLLSSFLFVLMVFHACNGVWCGDFWIHAVVVRELATHPFAPQHPQMLMNAAHAFYSPYTLGVAWLVRIFSLSPIQALSMAGLFNFLLFMSGLKIFVTLLLGPGRRAFYTLLLTLFLWGQTPWFFSGFFHFKVLGYVLPYPSTFAMALVFYGLSMVILFLRQRSWWMLFALYLLSTVVLLTHTLSAVVLYVGFLALAVGCSQEKVMDGVLVLLLVPLSLFLAMAWPYYSISQLFMTKGAFIDAENICMYQGVWGSIGPSFIGFWPLFLRIKSNKRDPLVLMFIALAFIYVYGGITGHYSCGRVISFLVFVLHLAIADWISNHERFFEQKFIEKSLFLLITGFFILGLFYNCAPQARVYWPGIKNSYNQYLFLGKYTKQYDVILADLETSDYVPVFGGKVVAYKHSRPFVKDSQERINDVNAFFDKQASLKERQAIINKYHVHFILISKEKQSQGPSVKDFASLGQAVYVDQKFALIKFTP